MYTYWIFVEGSLSHQPDFVREAERDQLAKEATGGQLPSLAGDFRWLIETLRHRWAALIHALTTPQPRPKRNVRRRYSH
jgi:hypothetical protein